MKSLEDKSQLSDSRYVVIRDSDNENKNALVQCEDCETTFKTEYHLENHLKSSQHSIKSGLNRKFGYKLNQKTARNKLLKGALKNPLVKEVKSSCEILTLNDGAYFVSVLPLIEEWKVKQKTGAPLKYNNLDIFITEFKCGKEQNGLVVDVLIKFETNGFKVVTHCYNTKQKIMVNGAGYHKFVDQYLEPFLKASIEENILKVQNYNIAVTETFGTTKRKNVRYRPGSNKFSCNKCDYDADDSSNMSTHRRISHPNDKKKSLPSLEVITSTRDNSLIEIMNEDISIVDIDEKEDLKVAIPMLTLEEAVEKEVPIIPNKFHCYICQAGFVDEENLTKHEKYEHSEQLVDDLKSHEASTVEQLQMEVQEIPSCEKCDFESENQEEYLIHKERNIHNIQSNNQMMDNDDKETKSIQFNKCEKCEYRGKDIKDLTEHILSVHETSSFRCDRCEFITIEKKLLVKHEKSTHGIIVFECDACEYSAIDKDVLANHKMTHTGRNNFICGTCEFETTEQKILNEHMKNKHPKIKQQKPKIKCDKCEKYFPDDVLFDYHNCSPDTKFACDYCPFMSISLNELLKHVLDDHVKSKYPCSYCEHEAQDESSLKKHVFTEHEDSAYITLIANQQLMLLEQMHELKQENSTKVNSLIEGQNYLKSEIMLLREELATIESKTKIKEPQAEPVKNVKNSKNVEEDAIANKTGKNKTDSAANHTKHSNTNNEKHKAKKKIKNVVWVGTPASESLDPVKFESDTNTNLNVIKAYGVKREDNQFYPDKNFTDIVPKVLREENPDAIILEAGSIEISNMQVKEALEKPDINIESVKKQWAEKVEQDSRNIFNLAEEATKYNPEIDVVIVKRLPRFDPHSSDPIGIRSKLTKFGNELYDQLWFKAGGPKNIHITNLDMNLDQSEHIRKLVFGPRSARNYDGVHLRGSGATRHFTYRAVQAVRAVFPRQNSAVSGERESYHRNCPQAQYQRRQLQLGNYYNQQKNSLNTEQFVFPRRFVRNRHVRNEQSRTIRYGATYYNIPVHNRFSENY